MFSSNKKKQLSMVNFDIDNYTIQDLEKLFQLRRQYKKEDIELSYYSITQKIMNDSEIDATMKHRLVSFYKNAQIKLIQTSVPAPLPATTFQLQGREQLDTRDNIWAPSEPAAYSGGTEYGRVGSTLNVYDPSLSRRDVNEVVRHNDKDFIHTDNSSVYAGVINPLNVRFIHTFLTIDSRFRETPYSTSLVGSSSDFTIQLPDKISRVISMQLSSVEIPITYYATSAYIGNNFMSVGILDVSGNTVSQLIVVPDGTYTPATMATAINAGFTSAGGIFATLSIAYNSTNGHMTISTSSLLITSFEINFTTSSLGTPISFTQCNNDLQYCQTEPVVQTVSYTAKTPANVDLTRRLGYSLGFLSGIYSGAKSYVSESVANTTGSRYIYLAVDDFNYNTISHQFYTNSKQNLNKNTLARITVGNGGFLSVLSENDFKIITEPRKYFGAVDITRLHVQLFDEYGLLLNMNGSDFSFHLMMEIVYDL